MNRRARCAGPVTPTASAYPSAPLFDRLASVARAERTRCPVHLRPDARQRAEEALAQEGRDHSTQPLFLMLEDEAAIARESLVRTVARQRDRDLFAREFAHAVGRQGARVGEGLVEHVGDLVDQFEVARRDGARAVIGREALGNLLRISRFVERRLIEADRAGLHRLRARFGHQRDDRAAVDPARQKGAERNVGDHAVCDGGAHQMDQMFGRLALARPDALRKIGRPPARRCRDRLAAFEQQEMSRGQFLDPRDDAIVVGNITERDKILDRRQIRLLPQQRVAKKPLKLRRKGDRAVGQSHEVQRLHAQPVAREEQASAPVIVDRKGEHAVQPRKALRSPLPPRGDDHLCIAARPEPVPPVLQLGTQLAEIVDFTVIGERDRLVVARHRLRAALDVDDREAEMTKADAGRGPFTRTVGTAMRHRVQHRADARRVDRLCRLHMINARDPAHILVA